MVEERRRDSQDVEGHDGREEGEERRKRRGKE